MSENDKKGEFLPTGYKRGRWAGKFILVRKPHFEVIQEWAKQSGMSKAAFYRAALMRGALDLARGMGVEGGYPELID